MVDGPPGPAIVAAHELIVRHGRGRSCPSCRDDWCPAAEWALWVAVTDQQPPEDRDLVTVVARKVFLVHRAHPVDGCRPCGLPDCERTEIASAWLLRVGQLREVRIWQLTPPEA